MIEFDFPTTMITKVPTVTPTQTHIPSVAAPQGSVKIKVVGVGGAGGNTVNYMIDSNLITDVDFIVANTDAQALATSKASVKIQLGAKSAKGLGSGANPELGKKAAEEDLDKLVTELAGADMVFLTGGLGGGTGSGAIPVIAQALREKNMLCVVVITKPFIFEGKRRMAVAQHALDQLKKSVDTLIVIPNQKLLEATDARISLIHAFGQVNDVIYQFVKSIADIITKPGHMNVDFADVKVIMKNMGLAVMGTSKASGEDRAQKAALNAITSPLLENMSITGARSILVNVTGGPDLGLHELGLAASTLQEQVDEDATIIVGSVIDPTMRDELQVTVIATGFTAPQPEPRNREFVAAPSRIPVVTPEREMGTMTTQGVTGQSTVDRNDLEVPTLLRRMLQEKQVQYKN